MMDSVLECLNRKEVRQRILEVYTEGHPENWQKNATPEWVVRDMVGLVKDSPELVYVVLFNQEFLEELVFERGIARERIIFMADCADEGVLATGVYGVRTMVLPQEIRDPKKTIEFVAEKLCKVLYEGGPMPKTNNLVVFGNPPYQQEDGGHSKSAKPIYHLFIEAVIDYLNPRYHSFVVPSRWVAGGKGLNKFRARMMKDKHLRSIKHFPGSREVFKEVNIEFGVNYFLWDRDYQGKCDFNGKHRHLDEYDIILSDNEAVSILDKVLAVHGNNPYLDKRVCPTKPFGLRTFFKDWKTSGVKCYAQGRQEKLVDPGCFTDAGGILSKWKVCTSEANGAAQLDNGSGKKVISDVFIIEPNTICTETYIVVNVFDSKKEAENFISYMKTKFFRFMLGLRVITKHINKEKFSWVPDLGPYTTAPTDEELFKMFELTEEEVKYINSRIK